MAPRRQGPGGVERRTSEEFRVGSKSDGQGHSEARERGGRVRRGSGRLERGARARVVEWDEGF